MRRIDEIIVHCTATPEGMPMTVKRIDEIHRDEKHWSGIGYHIVIYLDSISIIFSTEFPTAFPSEIEGYAETPSPTPRTPQSLKIYGLHLNKMIKEKSVDSADLNDSVNKFTQSQKLKSANKQKTVPATSPHHFVFYIYIILTFFIIVFLKKRFH